MDFGLLLFWGMLVMVLLIGMMAINVAHGWTPLCLPKYIIHTIVLVVASFAVRKCWSSGLGVVDVSVSAAAAVFLSVKVKQWTT